MPSSVALSTVNPVEEDAEKVATPNATAPVRVEELVRHMQGVAPNQAVHRMLDVVRAAVQRPDVQAPLMQRVHIPVKKVVNVVANHQEREKRSEKLSRLMATAKRILM